MSFSAIVKEEISQLNTYKDKEQVRLELLGYLLTSNVSVVKNKIRFSTENEYNINRFAKLLSNLKIDNYSIEVQGNNYVIFFMKEELLKALPIKITNRIVHLDDIQIEGELYEKAFVRGAFLGAGSVNDPKKTYHLEIVFSGKESAMQIKEVLQRYEISVKELNRGKYDSIYLKEGEDISRFLAFIGASTGVLEFEEIRVMKDMRNNVNRVVNCETANLNKTVETAVRQIESIKFIKQKGKFKELSESLQEIAMLREEHPEANLTELGNMLTVSIGKSGVNHRLKKIEQIAEELEK